MNNSKKILFTILMLFSVASVKAMDPKATNGLLIEQINESNLGSKNKGDKLKDNGSPDSDSDEIDDRSESFLQKAKRPNNINISAGVAGAGILGAALHERARNCCSYYAARLKDSVSENIAQPLKNKLGATKNKLLGGIAILGSSFGLKKLNEKFGLKNPKEKLRTAYDYLKTDAYNDVYDKSCELSKNRKVQIGIGSTALVGGAALTYLWFKNRSVDSDNKGLKEVEKSLEDLDQEEEKERENLSESEIKAVEDENNSIVETSLEELDAHELAVELGDSISQQLDIPGMSELYECIVMNPAALADIDATEINRLLNDGQKVLLSLLIKKSENINNK